MPWAAALDEYSGATYYHNTATGEYSWELPPDATFGAALDVRGNDWVDVGIAVPEAAQCLTSADGSSRAQRGATPGAAAGAPGQSGCGSAGSGSADSRLVREPLHKKRRCVLTTVADCAERDDEKEIFKF